MAGWHFTPLSVRFIGDFGGYNQIMKENHNTDAERKGGRNMECAVIVMAVMDLVPIVIGVVSAAVREEKKRSELQKAE